MTDGPIARILVIDDDEHVRALLRTVLTDEGYEVLSASDGAEAIEHVRRRPPDLILLDLMMPRVSGWSFTEQYARMPGPHAPIIVITAASSSVLRFPDQGVQRVVPKPFSVDALLAHVRRTLG